MTGAAVPIDAIVLAGGGSRRLGRPKTTELIGGRTLLARVTDALVGVDRVVLVGSAQGASRADVVVREHPPGGGPVAALAAGLTEVRAPVVLTLAGDLPFLTPGVIADLGAALIGRPEAPATVVPGAPPGPQVALAVDDRGRDQYLLAVWRTGALREAITALGPVTGARLRDLEVTSVRRVELAGTPAPWWDCDTEAELAQARSWARQSSPDDPRPHPAGDLTRS